MRERVFRTVVFACVAAASLAAVTMPHQALGGDRASVGRVKIFASRRDPGLRCDRVFALPRTVRTPAVLTEAMRALLRGPTAAERRRGYGGWFSLRTAGMLRTVRITAGVAYVDLADFSSIVPNASTSCGSALLLAQLDRTARQFPTVRRAVYSFGGSRNAFYEWLQLSPPRS